MGSRNVPFCPPKSVKALYSSLSKLEIEFLDFDTFWGSSTCRTRIERLPAQNEWFLTFIVNLLYSRKKKVSVTTLYKWPKFQPFIYGIPELFCSDLFFSCYLSKIFHYGYRELLLTLLTKHLLSRRNVRIVICRRDKTWVLNLTFLPLSNLCLVWFVPRCVFWFLDLILNAFNLKQ